MNNMHQQLQAACLLGNAGVRLGFLGHRTRLAAVLWIAEIVGPR